MQYPRETLRKASPYLVTALVAALVYLNSFPGTFIQDDLLIVAWNPLLERFDLVELLRSDYWGGASNSGLYRPFTILSFYANRVLLGPQPFGFHLVNVLLHITVTLLLLRLFLEWGLSDKVAWFGALLFALHPIHTEVVNEVVGRSELLVAVFLLLAFLAARRSSVTAIIFTCVYFLLALLSKEHAVVFIVLLPVVDAFQARNIQIWRRRCILYLTLFLIVVSWMVWRDWGVVRIFERELYDPLHVPIAYYPPIERVLTALKLQGLYLAKLVIPWPLQAFYSGPDFPGQVKLLSWGGGIVLGGGIAATVALILGWRRFSLLALFGVLYTISFVPTSHVLFPVGVTFAERLTYFPSLWFCGGLAVLFGCVQGVRGGQRLFLVISLSYLLTLGTLCLVRNRDFSSEISLWQADVVRSPQNFVAWLALGETLTGEGRYSEAEAAFRRSLEIAPASAPSLRALAIFLMKTQRYTEAFDVAKRVVELQLANNDMRRAESNMGLMAEASLEMGEFAQTLYLLERGARFDDNEVKRPAVLGRALAGVGRCSEAMTEFQKIPAWKRDRGVALSFSQCLYHAERFDLAGEVLEPALNEPDNAAIWNFLGVVRAAQGRNLEALSSFQQAISQKPDNRYYRENLQRLLQKSQ